MSATSRAAPAFTLVELLVALALGAGVVTTALTLYARGRAALQTAEAIAQLGEQARYAFATLEADLQMAGYYGLTAAGGDFRLLQGGDVAAAAPASALRQGAAALAGLNAAAQACGLQFAVDLAVPVQAANNRYAAGVGAASACSAHPAAPALSDTLTIRRADSAAAPPQAGHLQLLADRSVHAVRFVLADGTLPPGTSLEADRLELHDLLTRFYYIATDSDGAPGVASLRVKALSSVSGHPAFIDTEVMSGIEDLQVEFAIDGGYVAPDALPAGAVVRGLRLWLRLRAQSPEPGFTDTCPWRYADVSYTPTAAECSYRRLLVSHVVALRNAPAP
jgi:type IV pilus assembly protein PilW